MVAETCSACDVEVQDWFCDHCGEPRNNCPDCGGKFTEGKCNSCGQPRKAPCKECGRLISVATEECPHCSHNPGSKRKTSSMTIIAIGAVFGLGIPLIGAYMFDGILGILVGGLLFIILIPVALLMTGGGILGVSSSSGKKPASIEKGKSMYGVDNPKIEIPKQKVPDACPECSRNWETFKFGNTIESQGYEELKDDRYQCSGCDHIVQI